MFTMHDVWFLTLALFLGRFSYDMFGLGFTLVVQYFRTRALKKKYPNGIPLDTFSLSDLSELGGDLYSRFGALPPQEVHVPASGTGRTHGQYL